MGPFRWNISLPHYNIALRDQCTSYGYVFDSFTKIYVSRSNKINRAYSPFPRTPSSLVASESTLLNRPSAPAIALSTAACTST